MKFSISALAAALVTLPAVLAFPVENGAPIGVRELDHLDLVARNAEASLDILASKIVETRGIHSNPPSTGAPPAAQSPPPGALPSVATIVQDFETRCPEKSKHLLFWSGVGPDGAAVFAKKHSRYTLEDLTVDKNGQNKYSTYTSKPWNAGGKEAWEALSEAMATFAKGEVWAVQTDAKRLDPGTVWARVERPILKKRKIAIRYFKPTGEEVDEKGNLKSGTKEGASTSPPASPKSKGDASTSPPASPKSKGDASINPPASPKSKEGASTSPPASPKSSPKKSPKLRSHLRRSLESSTSSNKSGRSAAPKRAQLAKALRKRLVADASIARRGIQVDSFSQLQWL